MSEIVIAGGDIVFVDATDLVWLEGYSWSLKRRGRVHYAITNIKGLDGKSRSVSMHKLMLNPPEDKEIDHIDGNGLNNRRRNLRIVTHRQNGANQRKRVGASSVYKGVSWHSRGKIWHAQINAEGAVRHLGDFKDEKDAALAYDKAAIKYFGEHSSLNFPKDGPSCRIGTVEHRLKTPEDCSCSGTMYDGRCPVCDGGLSICWTCQLYEGSLTTECPGEPSYIKYSKSVHEGRIDFVNGQWRESVSIHSPARHHQKAMEESRV